MVVQLRRHSAGFWCGQLTPHADPREHREQQQGRVAVPLHGEGTSVERAVVRRHRRYAIHVAGAGRGRLNDSSYLRLLTRVMCRQFRVFADNTVTR